MYCPLCGDEIVAGERRIPVEGETVHQECYRPPNVLGSVTPTQSVEVKIGDRWIRGGVEGAVHINGEWVVRLFLDELVPDGSTDIVELSQYKTACGWTDPEGRECIPQFDDDDSREMDEETRELGPIQVREPAVV